jgi:hypothetical protein
MGFVLDASVSAYWALDDEAHTIADVALDLSTVEEIRGLVFGGLRSVTC